MATITPLDAADNGADSRTTINTNFTNLNTDKIEVSTTDTLTNKTIDADSNTISNLELDNIKASAKTGLDTQMVTGTPGTTDRLAKWNTDNDLVDAGVEVSTDSTLGGGSPVDTKVPSEQATKTYIDNKVGTKTAFFRCTDGSGGSLSATDIDWGYLLNTINDDGYMYFNTPSNFNVDNFSAKILLQSNNTTAGATATFTVSNVFGDPTSNEDYNNHTDSQTVTTAALDQNQLATIDITDSFTLIAANDAGSVHLNLDSISGGTYSYYIKGLIFEW